MADHPRGFCLADFLQTLRPLARQVLLVCNCQQSFRDGAGSKGWLRRHALPLQQVHKSSNQGVDPMAVRPRMSCDFLKMVLDNA